MQIFIKSFCLHIATMERNFYAKLRKGSPLTFEFTVPKDLVIQNNLEVGKVYDLSIMLPEGKDSEKSTRG